MDRIFERGLLYDFYGELLTPHQQKIYSGVVMEDMSLGELSEEEGISRQGIHDLIKRCDKILEDYENKLHLIERFRNIRNTVDDMSDLIENVDNDEIKKSLSADLIKITEEL